MSPAPPCGTRPRRQRGYLLLEAAIAGAILAVALGTLLSQLTTARTDLTRAAYRDVAVGLAHGKVSELEALPTRAISAWSAWASPGAAYPNFEWRFRLVDGDLVGAESNTDRPSGSGISTSLYLIEAEVSYPVRHASVDDMADGLADRRATVSVSRVVR